jgi:hypothetical protein
MCCCRLNCLTARRTPDDQSFEVQLRSTGEVFDVPIDKSILDVLIEWGEQAP